MNESTIQALLLIVFGAFFVVYNIRMMRDENLLRKYVQTSPKARLWRKWYGEEKTISLCKKYFLPIGTLVAGLMVFAGISFLFS